ncbi:unnamed protein product [Merluccius merluccius]
MSGNDISRVIHHATGVLCSNTGSMSSLDLYREILRCFDMTEGDFWFTVRNCPRFWVVSRGTGDLDADSVVVAKTSLRLCQKYCKDNYCADCQELHICKYYVYGNCRFGKNRKPCKFSHDIRSQHNHPLLRECTLQELSEDDLFLLLLQNDPTLLPEVCVHYNKGVMPHGTCTFRESCTKMHLCMHFVQGDCMFGSRCQRLHTINQRGRHVLEERGLCSGDIIRNLPIIYQNRHRLAGAPSTTEGAGAPQDERSYICLHFLRKSCQFEDQCMNVHFTRPYKWEVFNGCGWCDLRHMEEIELAYCNPCATKSPGASPVDFINMTWTNSQPVRRLSTVSSVTKPPHYTLTTKWLWYYEECRGSWVEYGQADNKQRTTSVTSRDLELAYQKNRFGEVKIMKGFREYKLCFSDMYQRNPKHITKRRVRRRPHFLSVCDMEQPAQ